MFMEDTMVWEKKSENSVGVLKRKNHKDKGLYNHEYAA